MYYVFQYFSPVTSKKWYKSTKASQSTLQKTCYSLVGRVLIANYQWPFELQTSEKDCQLEIEMLYQKAAHVAHASFVRQITGTIYWRTVKPWNDHHGSCSRNLMIILEDIEKKKSCWESQNCLRNQKFYYLDLVYLTGLTILSLVKMTNVLTHIHKWVCFQTTFH